MTLPRKLSDLFMSVQRPAAASIMTIDASLPPMGIVLVRMSSKTFYIFICLTRFCDTVAHKDAPISRPVLRVDDDSGLEAVPQFLGLLVSLNEQFWTPAHREVAL